MGWVRSGEEAHAAAASQQPAHRTRSPSAGEHKSPLCEPSFSPVQEAELKSDREQSVDAQRRALQHPGTPVESPCAMTRAAAAGGPAPKATRGRAPARSAPAPQRGHGGPLPRLNPRYPERAELLAREALEGVRSGLSPKDKLRRMQDICEHADGSVVRLCFEGIGWNSKLATADAPFGRWEHCPMFQDAVNRLTLAVSALNLGEPLPTQAQFEELEVNYLFFCCACRLAVGRLHLAVCLVLRLTLRLLKSACLPAAARAQKSMIFVKLVGAASYKACSALESSAVWLHDILTLRGHDIRKLDLSATQCVKLAGRNLPRLLAPLTEGARVRELHLSGSPLQYIGACAVASLLSHPRCSVEKIFLSNCYFCTRVPPPRRLAPPPLLLISPLPRGCSVTVFSASHIACSFFG